LSKVSPPVRYNLERNETSLHARRLTSTNRLPSLGKGPPSISFLFQCHLAVERFHDPEIPEDRPEEKRHEPVDLCLDAPSPRHGGGGSLRSSNLLAFDWSRSAHDWIDGVDLEITTGFVASEIASTSADDEQILINRRATSVLDGSVRGDDPLSAKTPRGCKNFLSLRSRTCAKATIGALFVIASS
jgi:hypothetical protein